MNRKKSRELAIKFLYEMTINKCTYGEIVENYKESNLEKGEKVLESIDSNYVQELIEGVNENKQKLDEQIEKHMIKWTINRLSKINMVILKVAVYEIMYKEDIPNIVSVNEAVEIAKKYSDSKSAAFINGVLDSIIK